MAERSSWVIVGAESLDDLSGGIPRYVLSLATALKALGASVDGVVVGSGRAEQGVLSHVSDPGAQILERLSALYRYAAPIDADILDVHFSLYALPFLARRARRQRLVVHFHGPWADEHLAAGGASLVASVKRGLEGFVYARADAVVTVSEAFRDLVSSRYRVNPAKVCVIPPGVDLEFFHPGDRARARAALGLPSTGFVVLSARRLERRMGLDVLLKAWSAVERVAPDAVLAIAGDGPERPTLEELSSRLEHPEQVRLLGRVSDDVLVQLYQAADCSVVPSRSLEGFGLVTLESLACGTPPVVSDVGGLPEAVTHLDGSLVVPAESASALAARIVAAIEGDLPSRSVARAHAERFSWRRAAEGHVALTEQLRRRPPRVTFIDHCAQLSGAELALARLLPVLEVDGNVVLGEDGPLVQRLVDSGASVRIAPLPAAVRTVRRADVRWRVIMQAGATARYVLRLARELRRDRPDVVHTNSLKAALYGGVAARLAGVPVVWHLHDRISPDYLPAGAVWLVRLASRLLPSSIIANSNATGATVRQARVKVTTIPCVVGVEVGTLPESRDPVRRVGILGRVAPWKGQDLFLRAFASAFPDSDVEAVIIGSPLFGEEEFLQELIRLVKELELEGRVDFRGFRDDIVSELERLDIVVHASVIPEPFGQVVAEAMAVGVPLVAADEGGPAEIVEHGVSGLLYPMGDERALVATLRRLAGDKQLRRHLATEGRKAVAPMTSSAVAGAVMSVYASVMAKR